MEGIPMRSMWRSLLFVFVKLSVFISVSVCAATLQRPMLWSLERGGARSYIFGTLHLGVSIKDLPPAVMESIDASSVFAMETNLDAIDPKQLKALQTLPEGVKLEDLIPESAWETLRSAFEGRVAAETLDTYRPWFVETELLKLFANSQGLSTEQPLDVALRNYSQARTKKISFLESWQLQFVTLDAMTNAYDLMKLLVPTPDGSRDNLKLLYEAYASGDASRLEPFATPNTPESGMNEAQVYLLLSNRNSHWAPVLDRMFSEASTFVAVGALHLVGPHGVLALLKARGYEVKQLERPEKLKPIQGYD